MEARFFLRATQRMRLKPAIRKLHTRPSLKTKQANPIGDYYLSILESSSPTITSKPPTTASLSSTPPITSQPVEKPAEPAILFSSRLSSPLERRDEIKKKSTLIAGIWVPPRPSEPDNCCMSGCVNCVWDRYGDELVEWAAARKEVDRALVKEERAEKVKKRRKGVGTGLMLGEGEKGAEHTMVSMDDDGGGSESNWGTGLNADLSSDELFKGVPVGIREFMKQEKRLKEKHAREGTTG